MGTEAAKVRLLLKRAGFGAPPAEAAHWAEQGLAATVDALLAAPAVPEPIAPPDLGKTPYDVEKLADIQAYWLHRMVTTRYPLVEKLTLFWHNHFATGVTKAKPPLMQRQNELLRRYALGPFPVLLGEIARDGAMLLWLDGSGSSRRAPNENYAREVMELFTTGPGPYTETDIKEGARAFTGWRVDRDTGAVSFNQKAWDPGIKRFLGQTGAFGADEIAAILAKRPETPLFLAGKLWRWFASTATPDVETVKAMAEAYRQSGGELRPMLRVLFLADSFYATAGSLVKSPAELVAGTLRLLKLPAGREAAGVCSQMGMVLFNPPNVAGWPGGAAWLGASTLLTRWNFGETVRTLLGQKPRPELSAPGDTPAAWVDWWLEYFGLSDAADATRQALLGLVGARLPADAKGRWELTRNLVRTVVAAPEYQST